MVPLLLALAMMTPPHMAYTFVPLGHIVSNPVSFVGQRIRTTGRFEVRLHSTFTVDGWLESHGVRLRLVGPVFDWQPVPGQLMEVWGMLRHDPAFGDYLDFFNGRPTNDLKRAPRITSAFVPGRAVDILGRVRQEGSAPFIRWVLQLEDRTEVDLAGFPPAGQDSIAGALLEVHGIAEAGGFPPATATVKVLEIHPVPGVPPVPFGG